MPNIDFPNVPDPLDFTPIPEGPYLCQVEEAEQTQTRDGDEMWRLRLAVLNGPYEGRIIFDNLVFSDRAKPRVKLFCSALGLDTSASVNLVPELILQRRCRVTVHVEEYVDREGATRKRNSVPYRGYAPHTSNPNNEATGLRKITEDGANHDLPF